jgi:2-hydroxychromene-2-carboxylate isomerase
MTQTFEDQGGAATSNPSPFKRWITSRIMCRVADPARRKMQRDRVEGKRLKAGLAHRVEYFHQLDDAYSYLAAQALAPLIKLYDIDLVPHLVAAPAGKNAPEPDLLLSYAAVDAARVAPHYGLQFPADAVAPAADQIQLAARILAAVDAADFPAAAVAVGASLWGGDASNLQNLAVFYDAVDDQLAAVRLEIGSARREQLGHYAGAMFYYGEEWYWGVDRLYHLENRLLSLAVRKGPGRQLIVSRPGIEAGTLKDSGSLTLEIYASLRSPYTSIIFDRAVELAQNTGVKLVLRPVLPMVMRGVPVTRQKGLYIFGDAAREAEALGIPWGNVYDPIGAPVLRAYSLFPWAVEQGRGTDLLSAFLHAAFYDGVNLQTDAGMRTVVETAGLSWDMAQQFIDSHAWEDQLEQNRLAMYGFGCWGVPAFRLLNEHGDVMLGVWGQDRLWLVAREIQHLLEMRDSPA